jgi:hypothetical protein
VSLSKEIRKTGLAREATIVADEIEDGLRVVLRREQKLQRETGSAQSSDEVESLSAVSRAQKEVGDRLGGVVEGARLGGGKMEAEEVSIQAVFAWLQMQLSV